MAEYFNAREILPTELMNEVMEYVPEGSRNGVLLYFSEDYYAKRNAEIVKCFEIYQADADFGSQLEICEALSEQYGLTVRWICTLLKEAGVKSERCGNGRRRFSGVRVSRCSRRMRLRTAAP